MEEDLFISRTLRRIVTYPSCQDIGMLLGVHRRSTEIQLGPTCKRKRASVDLYERNRRERTRVHNTQQSHETYSGTFPDEGELATTRDETVTV